MSQTICVGISTCLLGREVRYNGGHKRDAFLLETMETLDPPVRWAPVCPEMEAGFGIPREPVDLTGSPDAPRMVTKHTGRDMTDAMTAWITKRLDELAKENIRGFVLKSKSPSCQIEKDGYMGIFTRAFIQRFPDVPVIDEVRFRDETLRNEFIEKIMPPAGMRRMHPLG